MPGNGAAILMLSGRRGEAYPIGIRIDDEAPPEEGATRAFQPRKNDFAVGSYDDEGPILKRLHGHARRLQGAPPLPWDPLPTRPAARGAALIR